MRIAPSDPLRATTRARALRRMATPAEATLWTALRRRALAGLRAKRQVPYGPYILDFAIPAVRLVIEVDGETHGTAAGQQADARRDAFLGAQGWRVVRFSNREVLTNLEGVLTAILSAAGACVPTDPHPGPLAAAESPLPRAGEGWVRVSRQDQPAVPTNPHPSPLPHAGEGAAESPLPLAGEGWVRVSTSDQAAVPTNPHPSPLPQAGEGAAESPLPLAGEGWVRVSTSDQAAVPTNPHPSPLPQAGEGAAP